MNQKSSPQQGYLISNDVKLEPHELETIMLLMQAGSDITLIPKSNKHGEHTPDIKMLGLPWEIKCPKGQGKYLIQNTLHKAVNQSENIIIDLRRIKIHQTNCFDKIKKEFRLTKRIKRIKIITKSRKIIDFKK